MTNSFTITADQILLDGVLVPNKALVIEDGVIRDITDAPAGTSVGDILVPGFFDTQVNGGGGALFNNDPSADTIKTIGTAHAAFGTTRFLPTLISDDLDKVAQAIAAVDAAISAGVPGVAGIHLEGPFLNADKKGVHDARKFMRLTMEHVPLLASLKHGKTLVTVAPELADADAIRALVEAGVIVSAGHTAASYEDMKAALDLGVTGFTHLYNAMTGFESRAPGVVGAAFDSPGTWAGLIADGHHVHPAVLCHTINTLGQDRAMLVTDAMPTVGSDKAEFILGDENIVATGGRCTTADGVLAGSDLDMASAVRYVAETLGFGVEKAVTMASQTPATFMGLSGTVGSLDIGRTADFVLLDKSMTVKSVWIGGNPITGNPKNAPA